MFDSGGHTTRFYIDVLYGVLFFSAFVSLVYDMKPVVAGFTGGLVAGYFLHVWGKMETYEAKVEETVSAEAERQVSTEVDEQVGDVRKRVEGGVEEHVQEKVEERVEERVEEFVDKKVEERVDEIRDGGA